MSGYQPTYVPGQRSGSGNVSGQAPSFKTNVNRNKTKRWVNAKQVSYDGDDWGSSEEDDVDEQPPPMPSLGPPSQAAEGQQYPHVETRTGFPAVVNSPPQFKGQPGASEGAPPSGGNVTSPRDEQGRPVPFIRPADIYKRMAEERERERQRTGETPSGSPAPANNTQPPVTAVSQPEVPEPEQQNIPQEVTKPSNSPDTEKTPGISQIPPLGSGADTQDSSTTPTQAKTTPASTETGLQHNPSLGLRSVVHQAFDTPETPSTTTGTFSRSNSDSTSIISPIIRSNQHSVHENRAPDADQTPTIKEEPSEATSPAEPVPGFKPGHRRSMTPPTSGMAPVGHPILTTPIQAPRSEWGDMAGSGSMEPGSKTAPVGGPDAADHSSQSAGTFGHQSSNIEPPKDDHDADRQKKRDSIPPLAIRTASGGDRTDEPPSISAPRNFSPSSGETSSPNERLRREIMQSLSPSPGASASPHERESSTGAPNGEEPEDNATTPIQQQPSATSPAAPIVPSQVESVAPSDAKQDGEENVQRQSYQLQKRFSWEEDSSDEEAATPQRKPEVEAPQDTRSSSPELKDPSEPSATGRSSLSENARGQLVVPAKSAELDEPSAQSPIVLQDNISDRGEAGPRSSVDAPELKVEEPVEQQAVKPLPLPQDPNLPGFREILAIKLPQDKVKKFDETREQFAFMDTGLDAWLIQTSESIPEHSDLVELNGRLPAATAAMLQKSATSRTKFPKISGLGSLSLQTSHQDGSTSSPSHARTPSGMQLNSQQMQARGKDLLHSAGVLSGKAGGAAKGLFAKGRSRFRNSGSGEKVDP